LKIRNLLLIASLLCTGCLSLSRTYRVHPGSGGFVSGQPTATQLFISQSYDVLLAADAVIVKTRADFLANRFPVSAMPRIRTSFNALVSAYDAAEQSWVAFNASASAGASTDQSALLAAIAALNQQMTALAASKVGN
jgi:hypothetical protein